MKTELTEKLIEICGSNSNVPFSIKNLTTTQLKKVEAELIKYFEFSRIVWMELPSGLTEDGARTIFAQSLQVGLGNPKHTDKIGYIYTISFTPLIYDLSTINTPVKDGCVMSPTIYDPVTFEPIRSITLTWSPEIVQDYPNVDAEEFVKQTLINKLIKVLSNPDDYKPEGFRGCIIRYASV